LVEWSVLCRTTEQLGASIAAGCRTVYADLDDPSLCSDAVRQVRQSPGIRILLATPRIQMPGEEKVFREIDSARPDGVLIRNLGALEYFRKSPLEKVGDFSLNVTNPLAARLLIDEGLARVTLALDLSPDQALALLRAARPAWFEMIVHQHLPMFHTAHCLFAANLSKSADPANCGRPCQRQAIRLRDRKGVEHPVRRDAFCRTTVFQSSLRKSEALETWRAAGLRHFRIELLEETGRETEKVIAGWRDPG
jgi:putative protease